MEQKEAAYYYTEGSCVNNEPLYGQKYIGFKDVNVALTKHNPNLTKLINDTAIPKDTWLRTGQNWPTFSGVFGIDIEDKIHEAQAKARSLLKKQIIKGTDINKAAANILTGDLQGRVGVQDAFMSTAFAKDAGFDDQRLNFEIFAPKGTKCLYAEPFSAYGDRDTSPTTWDGEQGTAVLGKRKEFEGILQRGTKFRIIEVAWDPNGPSIEGWTIKMEIIGQAPKSYQPSNPVKY